MDPPPSTSAASTSRSRGTGGGGTTTTGKTIPDSTSNPLFSAPIKNEALDNPSMLVSMTRQMLNKAAAFPAETVGSELELKGITAGQIADLCHLQHQKEDIAYTPLNPYSMSTKETPAQSSSSESERLDMRISALKKDLEQFKGDVVPE
jgi:hypothetical protein